MDMDDYYLPPSEMDAGEESDLWEEFIKTRDQELRNRLIEHYAILVYQAAERLSAKLPACVSVDDLISWGNFGLIDAIDRYDNNRGTKFSTYCGTRIVGHIYDEIRKLDWTPRNVRQRASALGRTREQLRSVLGRAPYDDEMIAEMGISNEEYQIMIKEVQPRNVVSINYKHTDDARNEVGKIELLPDNSVIDPLLEMQRREIKEIAIKGLNEDQKNVLVMYYYDELNMKEIGELLNLSESRVCQIHKQVLDFLREKFRDQKLAGAI